MVKHMPPGRPAPPADTPAKPGPAPSRRRLAAAGTRSRITAAARELFQARGFEAATTTEIAARAGVAKGTLFLHARTKERLLVLVYEEQIAAAVTEGFALPARATAIVPALAATLIRFFRIYEADMDLARHFVKEVMFQHLDEGSELRHLTDGVINGMAGMIEDGKRRGMVLPDVDAPLAAANAFLIYYGILTGWLTGWLRTTEERDRGLHDSLALLWRGLVPTKKPAGKSRTHERLPQRRKDSRQER